jgi:hypothetical protein
MLKPTQLYREVSLRVLFRVALREYNELVGRGMLTWEAYNKHRVCIDNSLQIIRDVLGQYKERRRRWRWVENSVTLIPHACLGSAKETATRNEKEEASIGCKVQFQEIYPQHQHVKLVHSKSVHEYPVFDYLRFRNSIYFERS